SADERLRLIATAISAARTSPRAIIRTASRSRISSSVPSSQRCPSMLREQLLRVRARLHRDLAPRQHPRELVDALRRFELVERCRNRRAVADLGNAKMMVGVGSDLREMRDA